MHFLPRWNAKLQNLVLLKEDGFRSYWLYGALREGGVLSRSTSTLQSIVGLVFDNRERRGGGGVGSFDLRGLSALKRLSLAANHQMQLWLPPAMEHLEIIIYRDRRDSISFYTGSVEQWRVGWGWGADAERVVRRYSDYDIEIRQREPMAWGEALVVAPVEDQSAAPPTGPRYGRPTWAGMLRGLTQLGTLQIHGSYDATWQPCRGSAGWDKPDQKGAYPIHFMGLADFEREWPAGFTLQSLHVTCGFVPFDLAVRDVERLQFSDAVVFMTRAAGASQILDLLLCGRARVVRFQSWRRKATRTRFTFVGPGLGRGVGVNPSDLANAARSSRLASRIAVKEFRAEAPDEGYCLEFTVVARRTDCNEKPGL